MKLSQILNEQKLNIPNVLKTVSPLELTLLSLFIIYIVLPIQTPNVFSGVIDSPLGMLVLFVTAVYLFVYTNPVLGILFVFVAYELLRRTSSGPKVTLMQYNPTQQRVDAEMKAMNPVVKETLEEEVVDKMAPIGKSDMSVYTPSTFKPVADNVAGASLI
jgi:hypothetical protein